MKHVKKITSLLIVVMLWAMLAASVSAAETGSAWLKVSAENDETTVILVTDTTVTDGLIELTYDSSKLTYADVTVSEEYVAYYSVNAEEKGVVKISWVAPEAYQTNGTGVALIKVHFNGTEAQSTVAVSGELYNEEGSLVPMSEVDTTQLQKAILKGEGLDSANYTADSFAAFEDALAAAKAVLADTEATQTEVDAAAKVLNDAIAALELSQGASSGDVNTTELQKAILEAKGLKSKNYTSDSFAAVEKALAAAETVLADTDATQAEVDAAAKTLREAMDALVLGIPGTGDATNLVLLSIMLLVSGCAIAALVVMKMRKRGNA